MENQFGHPSSAKLLESVANLFKIKKIFATNSRYIVFVCGGNDYGKIKAVRPRFMKYAQKNIPHVRFFLAEAATKDLLSHGKPRFLNVAEFEKLIADISDCILIFPESPGSIAEVAYFSKDQEIRKKILAVCHDELQGDDSFLSLGPLALIDKDSIFRQNIHFNYKSESVRISVCEAL